MATIPKKPTTMTNIELFQPKETQINSKLSLVNNPESSTLPNSNAADTQMSS